MKWVVCSRSGYLGVLKSWGPAAKGFLSGRGGGELGWFFISWRDSLGGGGGGSFRRVRPERSTPHNYVCEKFPATTTAHFWSLEILPVCL